MSISRRIGSLVFAALVSITLQTSQAFAQGLTPGEYKIGFITENTGPIAQAGQSFEFLDGDVEIHAPSGRTIVGVGVLRRNRET